MLTVAHRRERRKPVLKYLTSPNPFSRIFSPISRPLESSKLMTRKVLEKGVKMTVPVKNPQSYFFYRQVIGVLNRSFVPFLMGGGFAFEFYAHIGRSTKDMDLLVRRSDLEQAFEVLTRAGFETELTFPHWLGKVYYEESFIDIIFSSGNGLCEVDDLWFKHARSGQVFGPGKILPAGRNDLDKGLRYGARTLRRRR